MERVEEFRTTGAKIAAGNSCRPLSDREFISFFGATPEVLSECYCQIQDKQSAAQPKHMLWACLFLKLYLPEDVLAVMLGISKPTLRK